jgi:hypothetical protein
MKTIKIILERKAPYLVAQSHSKIHMLLMIEYRVEVKCNKLLGNVVK